MATKTILIIDIKIDGGTQQRPVDEAVVARYAALMKDGVGFPPVDLVRDGTRANGSRQREN